MKASSSDSTMRAPSDPCAPVVPSAAAAVRLRPIGLRGTQITGGLLAERRQVNKELTIPHGAAQLELAGNFANFRMAAGMHGGGRLDKTDDSGQPFPFLDSDVYKWLEAVGWELAQEERPAVAAEAERAIELIGAAQRDDGYLNTFVQVTAPGQEFRNLKWSHELYTVGHLIQGAIAWHRAVGDDRLLEIATRAVRRIAAELGPEGRELVDGHPGIEMALVELYRTTGDREHLNLASVLLERRGHALLGDDRFGARYWQDHEPVRTAPVPAGHAVRQMYLDCGAVDVAVETGDRALLDAVIRRWDAMVESRTYLTGGLGAHHRDEAFGDAYELPPDRAYAETCAAIGSVMLAWRLLLATGESRYADLIERTSLNAVLPGLALDGTHFFYTNPLQRRSDAVEADGAYESGQRRAWYACACCPPNLMRFLASLPDLVATVDATGLQIHQFATGRIATPTPFGHVELAIDTDYPWEGALEVTVVDSPPSPWGLSIRRPGWSQVATVSVNGVRAGIDAAHGTILLKRPWHTGDRVRVTFEMPPRITAPDPRIDAVRGCVALERGPLVYAVEEMDLPKGWGLDAIEVDPTRLPVPVEDPGLPAMTVLALDAIARKSPGSASWPYADPAEERQAQAGHAVPIRAVPYFAWGNRQPGGMRVWLPASEPPRPAPHERAAEPAANGGDA